MKIDGSGVDSLRQAIDRVGGPTAGVGGPAPGRSDKVPASGDQARFSADAQWLQAAVQTASRTPDIRQDVVDRMKAALNKGEIGADSERLADALLDSWISTR